MGSIGSRGSWVWFSAAVLAFGTGCAPRTAPLTTAAAADQLPEGPGRQVLMRACVSCHNLREVTKFKGFYARPQWRDIVQTMVDYGAPVNAKEVEVLTDYLTDHLGRR